MEGVFLARMVVAASCRLRRPSELRCDVGGRYVEDVMSASVVESPVSHMWSPSPYVDFLEFDGRLKLVCVFPELSDRRYSYSFPFSLSPFHPLHLSFFLPFSLFIPFAFCPLFGLFSLVPPCTCPSFSLSPLHPLYPLHLCFFLPSIPLHLSRLCPFPSFPRFPLYFLSYLSFLSFFVTFVVRLSKWYTWTDKGVG